MAARQRVPAALPLLGLAAGWPLEIEVYHINPYHFGPLPVDMNTGDALGDLFFDLKMVLMNGLLCQDPQSYFNDDCKNKEVASPDLVVNKLHLQVSGHWSNYAMCNIGLDNNTGPFGDPCPKGTYCCVCDAFMNSSFPCSAKVGRQTAKESMAWPSRDNCNATAPDWMCWQTQIQEKLPATQTGWWYSTLDYGYCPHHPGSRSNCTWQVASVDKVVNKTCHEDSFLGAVEAHNRSCFRGCGQARNVSSPCWTRCFYSAVLGPDAARPNGTVAGIPTDDLLRAWTAPFETEDPLLGGCPGLPTRSTAVPPKRVPRDPAAAEGPEPQPAPGLGLVV